MTSYDDDDDDDKKPVWPTWAVGALFRGARCIHINRVCFHIPYVKYDDILCNICSSTKHI